jgi:prepilin-type N-terminal cleavage/methylation domain-containing protein
MKCRKGFTLIEMLVAISIFIILLAMIVPSMQKARFSAQCLTCASNLKQLSTALQIYANDNRSYFPRFDPKMSTGRNCNEVGPGFYEEVSKYWVSDKIIYCPFYLGTEADKAFSRNYYAPTMYIFPVAYFVPRMDSDGVWHPSGPNFPTKRGNANQVLIACPVTRLTSATPSPPSIKGLTFWWNGYGYAAGDKGGGYHVWNGKIQNTSIGYADGHVEIHPADKITSYWQIGNYYTFY